MGHYNHLMLDLSKLKSGDPALRSGKLVTGCSCRSPNRLFRAGQSVFFMTILALLVLGCQTETPAIPTKAVPASTLSPAPSITVESQVMVKTVPPTFTPEAAAEFSSPTPANLPSRTPIPTNTTWPTYTPTSTITRTPPPTTAAIATAIPSPTAAAASDINLLPNPSFEEGWYHIDGIPELQVGNNWVLEWDVGFNHLDPDPWNEFVRPESRILTGDFIPADEHHLFIWDGNQTAKIFKQTGALSFRLFTHVYLEPGTYLFNISVFPDMIEGYTAIGSKIWASDPLSAELSFLTGSSVGNWIFPVFGQRNNFQHAFQVNTAGMVRVGVAFRGRWAIENNGWFLDDWSLNQLSP